MWQKFQVPNLFPSNDLYDIEFNALDRHIFSDLSSLRAETRKPQLKFLSQRTYTYVFSVFKLCLKKSCWLSVKSI